MFGACGVCPLSEINIIVSVSSPETAQHDPSATVIVNPSCDALHVSQTGHIIGTCRTPQPSRQRLEYCVELPRHVCEL